MIGNCETRTLSTVLPATFWLFYWFDSRVQSSRFNPFMLSQRRIRPAMHCKFLFIQMQKQKLKMPAVNSEIDWSRNKKKSPSNTGFIKRLPLREMKRLFQNNVPLARSSKRSGISEAATATLQRQLPRTCKWVWNDEGGKGETVLCWRLSNVVAVASKSFMERMLRIGRHYPGRLSRQEWRAVASKSDFPRYSQPFPY